MDKLWAPWRMEYIHDIDSQDKECIFCSKPKQENDRDNLILHRGEHTFIIMNKYPYNNGHLMVVPYTHTSDSCAIPDVVAVEMWQCINRSISALKKVMQPDGFNIGMNIGRTAGAGIDQHLHMHVVPRWNGDTNFMPVVGQTKVISQGLYEAYDALVPYVTLTTSNGRGD